MIEMPMSAASRRIRRVALGDFVYRSALRYPDSTAVVDSDIRLSYAELDARSSRFAHWLISEVGDDRQVGMLCSNSADMVVAFNGIHKSGNVWVPVNTMLDAATVEYVLRHAEVSAVVVDAEFLSNEATAAVLSRLDVPLIVTRAGGDAPHAGNSRTLAEAEAGQSDTLPEVDIDGNRPALIMYTSGTTGNPKGVVHSHLSVATSVVGNVTGYGYCKSDVVSCFMPMFHCAQHGMTANAHAVGACIVITRTFDPAQMRTLITAEKVSVVFVLPMMFAALLEDPEFAPNTIRLCIYAMAPIPKPLIERMVQRLSPNIVLGTGQTEMYPVTMVFDAIANPDLDANYWGVSLIHNETAVMDDDGNILGPGQVGEIVHRGSNAMLGYFKDPEATAEAQKFGWHHTGDLGMWGPRGQMLFVDRKKDMIKTGGENVASVKVESAILAYPGVANVAVVGMPHPRWTEAVCAFVIAKPDATVDEAGLEAHCREHLGKFEVPKLIRVVDALPMTSTGKIQKNNVRTQFASMAEQAWDNANT